MPNATDFVIHWDTTATGTGTIAAPRAYLRSIEEDEYLADLDVALGLAKTRTKKDGVLAFVQTIGEAFVKKSFQKDKAEAHVAVEFENEANNPVDLDNLPAGWAFHNEGSLRNYGAEFVMRAPLPIAATKREVELLCKAYKDVQWSNSIRTSIHVHFDVTRYRFRDIVNFAAVYWILEDYLSDFAGQHRKGNLFCLRAKDADYLVSAMAEAVSKRNFVSMNAVDNSYRYASVNLAALKKFGSFEFRLMRGTSSAYEINLWLDVLERIRQFALKFKTPLALRNYFLNDVSAEAFPSVVLGELDKEILKYRVSKVDIQEQIRDGFLRVEQMLLVGKDWDFSAEIKDIVDRQKKAEAEAAEAAELRARLEATIMRPFSRARTPEETLPDNQQDQYRNGMQVLSNIATGDI